MSPSPAEAQADLLTRIEQARASLPSGEQLGGAHDERRRDFVVLARAYLERRETLDRADRALAEAAAAQLEQLGELEPAGDVLLRAGFAQRAAACFERAGALEKLERAYFEHELASDRGEGRQALADFEQAERSGDLMAAKQHLERALRLHAGPLPPALTELRRRFEARWPEAARLRLRLAQGEERWLLGDERVVLGRSREVALVLAGPELARHHCAIASTPAGEWEIRDLGSTNGTWLDEVRVEACLFPASGSLRLGPHCAFAFVCARGEEGDGVLLRPPLGELAYFVGRRLRFVLAQSGVGGVDLSLREGYWYLEPHPELTVDGVSARMPMLLRRGAELRIGGQLWATTL